MQNKPIRVFGAQKDRDFHLSYVLLRCDQSGFEVKKHSLLNFFLPEPLYAE